MTDPVQQLTVLTFLRALIGLVWIGCTLSAWMGYRAFKQRADMGWAIAFSLLALAQFGDGLIANSLRADVLLLPNQLRQAAEFTTFNQLRLAAFELVASFALFYLFRDRRRTY